jgi:hypothetical protein
MLCPWGQNMGIWTFFGVLTNGVRAHVSRVGTHRSNEWEGRHGCVITIHAARDSNVKVKIWIKVEYRFK